MLTAMDKSIYHHPLNFRPLEACLLNACVACIVRLCATSVCVTDVLSQTEQNAGRDEGGESKSERSHSRKF